MRTIRITAAAVLCLIAFYSIDAQCVSDVSQVSIRSSYLDVVGGPVAFAANTYALATTQPDSGQVWLSLLDANRQPIGRGSSIPDAAGSRLLDIVWNGTHFTLFYVLPDKRLALATISPFGGLIGPIVPSPNIVVEDAHDVDILWDPSLENFVIARAVTTGSRGVWLSYLEADGRVPANARLAAPSPHSFVHVVQTETGDIGVIYRENGTENVIMVRVDDRRNIIFIRPVWTADSELEVAIRGPEIALVKPRKVTYALGLAWKTIDSTGRDVRAESLLFRNEGREVEVQSLLGDGPEWALLYWDKPGPLDESPARLRLRRFSADGTLLSDTPVNATALKTSRLESDHSFVWTGTSYVVPATRRGTSVSETFLFRYCPLSAAIAAPAGARAGEDVRFAALAEGGIGPYSFAWTSNGGTPASGAEPVIRFAQSGVYEVTVQITDSTGAVSTSTHRITVTSGEAKRRAVRK